MKASENNFLSFLRKTTQFIIPIYQRTYSWNLEQCKQLWDDINEAGENNNISSHFIGSVVYIEQDTYQISSNTPMLVIDGQQRLATLFLLLEAFARELHIRQKEIDNMSSDKLRNRYLLNPSEDDEQEFKLLLTETDKDSLLALLKQKDLPSLFSVNIINNFNYFSEQLKKCNDEKLQNIWAGLNKIIVVDVALTRGKDNPQLIFESMNSTGKALSQVDLIRNFILMGLEEKQQRELYINYWRKMELSFGQEQYESIFNAFVRHYLTMKTKSIPRFDDIYDSYKKYKKENKNSIQDLVTDLYNYSTYFCDMFFGKKTKYSKDSLSQVFKSFKELQVDVAYPLLLELYGDFANGTLKENEFCEIVKLIESYIFRRSICEIPTNSLNKTFATFSRDIDKNDYLDSIKRNFLTLNDYRRFPNDEEFKLKICQRNVYDFRNSRYLLISLENIKRNKGKIVFTEEYTIEHIMPQTLSNEWKLELGDNWEDCYTEMLHTLGNLTLTEYNIEYSNEPFYKKLSLPEKGLKYSPLMLNAYFRTPELDKWNKDHIQKRANNLANDAIKMWIYPTISLEL